MPSQQQVSSIFSAEARADLYGAYDAIRAAGPLYHDELVDAWLVTGYETASRILVDVKTFSSETPGLEGTGTVLTSDPPRHTRMRELVNRGFTNRSVEAKRPYIREVAGQLLDEAGDAFDFVEKVAYPLPVIVIADILGIPKEEHARFKRWSDATTSYDLGRVMTQRFAAGEQLREMAGGTAGEEARALSGEMYAYFTEAVADRRERPRDDLISRLIEANAGGTVLGPREIVQFCRLLLVAGNETTTSLLANMTNYLVEDPDLWRKLREDRGLVDIVIEEALRYDSPISGHWRTATTEVTIDGVTIPKGANVMVLFGACNRDPAKFADPAAFRCDRELNDHLAFGRGHHYCLGAPLARLEARLTLNAMLDRYERIERGAGEPQRLSSVIIHGFKKLPVRTVLASARP